MLSGLIDGENLTYDKGYEAGLGITATSVGSVGGITFVGGAVAKSLMISKEISKIMQGLPLKELKGVNKKLTKKAIKKLLKTGKEVNETTLKNPLGKTFKGKASPGVKKYSYNTSTSLKSASTTAKFGGAIAGAAIGGYLGYQGAELLINSSPERYTNSDGTFATTKANCVKGGLTVGGAIIGGAAGWCIAAGTLAAIGPIGWGILGAAATVAVGFGLLSHFTNWWKK